MLFLKTTKTVIDVSMSVEFRVPTGSWLGERLRGAQASACSGSVAKKADHAVFEAATEAADGTRSIPLDKLVEMREHAMSLGCNSIVKERYQDLIDQANMTGGVLHITSLDDSGRVVFGSYLSDKLKAAKDKYHTLKEKVSDKKSSYCASDIAKYVDKPVFTKAKSTGMAISAKDLAKLKADAASKTGCSSDTKKRFDELIAKAEASEEEKLKVTGLDEHGMLMFGAHHGGSAHEVHFMAHGEPVSFEAH